MTNAQILYQDEILKYGRRPNNLGVLADANLQLQGDSPICGDHLRLYLRVDAGRIDAVSFSSSACCALCMASASMMTDAIKGLSIAGARGLREQFLAMVAGDEGAGERLQTPQLASLRVFERIREVPSRTECVSLSWNTLGTLLSAAHIARSNIAELAE